MPEKFYITASLPYTNAPSHIGHLLEFIQTDVLARYNRLLGKDVFFLTGTDEHGRKNVKAAEKEGKSPQDFVNAISESVRNLISKSGISIDAFVRTTDKNLHWPAVWKIWGKLEDNGDLYKAKYEGLYCVGHEAFIKKSELKNGLCPDHQIEPEKITEENYFFKLSKYKNKLEKLIQDDKIKILPVHRKNETLQLIKDSEDISFSRPKESINWGVPVSHDPEHIIYIWIEALISYLSGLGYANETEIFKKFWPPDIQVVGKDIMRFHTIVFPAMLLAAGLETPKSIYIHGFITVDGQKMSKTIGNVVDPFDLIKKYGADPVRYYLLREIPSYEDGDYSEKKFEARYNADLANNLGNLVSRVAVLIEKLFNGSFAYSRKYVLKEVDDKVINTWKKYIESLDNFKLHLALENVFSLADFANLFVDEHKPWALGDNPEHLNEVMMNLIVILLNVAWLLKPFLPETSNRIFEVLGADKDGKSWEEKPFQVRPKILFPKIQ